MLLKEVVRSIIVVVGCSYLDADETFANTVEKNRPSRTVGYDMFSVDSMRSIMVGR
jgi:hypothetical protein